MKSRPLAVVFAAGAIAAGALACPGRPKAVVYDLATRAAVAETWSEADVLRFGTPAAEPRLTEGFHREAGIGEEPFLWSKGEAEVGYQWPAPQARIAILDARPFQGVSGQSVTVKLNDEDVGRFALNDARFRYRIELPASAQRPGLNRLRFVFAKTAAPSDADPKSLDKRQLAAAFYSLVTSAAADASLEDLLSRDAPRPFVAAVDFQGVPSLTLVGPAMIRFALRLPPGAELRFTPELLPAARAAAGGASFRVTIEDASGEREIWNHTLGARSPAATEQVVRLPGKAGDIVRLGLAVGIVAPFANGPIQAILQATIAPDYQGRVFTLMGSIATATAPLGLLVAAPIAEVVGVRAWYLAGGLACIAMGIAGFLLPGLMRIEEPVHELPGVATPASTEPIAMASVTSTPHDAYLS